MPLSSIFLLKSHSHNCQPTLLRKGMGGVDCESCPGTLLKLSQNWEICVGKGDPNNFAKVTTILGNLFWKHCQLMKKCQPST